MTAKGSNRQYRTPRRRKSLPGPTTKRGRVTAPLSRVQQRELMNLVQTGVEKFIMNTITVDDFFSGIRAVVDRDKTYAHQLTRSVFSRIVKEAMRKRDPGKSS